MFDRLRELLFLILFFKLDGFAFRYPMNVFYTKGFTEDNILDKWTDYNKQDGYLQIYLHNALCDVRCNYCDCESLVRTDNNDMDEYRHFILSEISKYSGIVKKNINSIYFGGGTFNLWSNDEIKEICSAILGNFTLSNDYKWQVEIHPYYLNDGTLRILKDFGVTDIMIGVQTTSEKVNKLNNRKFSKQKLEDSINDIILLGFDKVSFDFMYNLPYMSEKDLIEDLDFAYELGIKLKNAGIDVNIEMNRWDISMKTVFANIFFNKSGKDGFLNICRYYINNSLKSVKIVDRYIDEKFLGLFDTEREEIEERKLKNTAILGIGLSSTSYIPGVIAYENTSYNSWRKKETSYMGYSLSEVDSLLFFIGNNLRRGIGKPILDSAMDKSEKFRNFFKEYELLFKENNFGEIYMDVTTDLENDYLNLYLIDDDIRDAQYEVLLGKWAKLGFNTSDLKEYTDIFLDYYYNRNKFFG